jgi:thiamine pyrophosphate-dependent acetolactate synthase large subunit-like protein
MGQLVTTLWPARKETREGSVADVAALLARSRRVCVLTGAGVSKESGIPTFRECRVLKWLSCSLS